MWCSWSTWFRSALTSISLRCACGQLCVPGASINPCTYETVKLCCVAFFAARYETERCSPVLEQVVEQQTRRVARAVGGFHFAVTDAMADGQLGERSVGQRCRRLGQLSKHVDQVPADRVQHSQIPSLYFAISKRERILRDGDDGLVFAQQQPVPDPLAVWHVLVSVKAMAVRLLVAHVVEGVVA